MTHGIKCIVVSPVVSEPPMSGNSARIKEVVSLLTQLGCDVTFILCPIKAMNSRKSGDRMSEVYGAQYIELNKGEVCRGSYGAALLNKLKKLIQPTGTKRSNQLHDFIFEDGFIDGKVQREFENIVAEIQPDLVVVEYVFLSKLIVNLSSKITTAVDTHDCFSDRNERIRKAGGTGFWLSLTQKQERKLLERFDHVIAIQKNEGAFFKTLLNDKIGRIITLSILSPPKLNIASCAKNQYQIGFIGSSNKHNLEGLKIFLDLHWQRIRDEIPSATLIVVGAKYLELAKWSEYGVIFAGRVDNLGDFYQQSAIIINPCITGSGLKIKSVEAMSYGNPLVTTKEGAEGLEEANVCGLFIEDLHSDMFAISCINLLKKNDLATLKGIENRKFIETSYKDTILLIKQIIK
jgi:polysaccharide biosynthesis protein PslH